MRHDHEMLRDYLVADVEDPRLNVQSILTRHFLIDAATEGRFAGLMEQELRFAVVMNWLLELGKDNLSGENFMAVLDALERGADNAEGVAIPPFATNIYRTLPVDVESIAIPNYLRRCLERAATDRTRLPFWDDTLGLFQRVWLEALASVTPRPVSVLEPACGSANDYRFLDGCGLGRLMNYTGFDLCEKNVANARALFPGTRFDVGNVFAIAAADKAFDLCFVHDLLEHLSPVGIERAVEEMCRVTRTGICLAFFSMHEGPDHIVRPVEDYHWNTLSFDRIRASFERHGFETEAIHIATFLKWRFACDETHNPAAYSLFCRVKPGGV
jgi:SAM-dependent methyltransferase